MTLCLARWPVGASGDYPHCCGAQWFDPGDHHVDEVVW